MTCSCSTEIWLIQLIQCAENEHTVGKLIRKLDNIFQKTMKFIMLTSVFVLAALSASIYGKT